LFVQIITKALANKIKLILPKVIDSSQYAFLSGRGLLDSIMTTNEVTGEI